MVYESYPWKKDLQRRKSLLIRYNQKEKLEQNFEATYTVIEKSIFYSAFIIRKLIDCFGKLSDEADKYSLLVNCRTPLKQVNQLNRLPDENSHDWETVMSKTVRAKDVCNWLIHSYIFCLPIDDSGTINSFFVTSDYDRNKILYEVSINEWIDYMDFISKDYVVSLCSNYDEKLKDYVYTNKERNKI